MPIATVGANATHADHDCPGAHGLRARCAEPAGRRWLRRRLDGRRRSRWSHRWRRREWWRRRRDGWRRRRDGWRRRRVDLQRAFGPDLPAPERLHRRLLFSVHVHARVQRLPRSRLTTLRLPAVRLRFTSLLPERHDLSAALRQLRAPGDPPRLRHLLPRAERLRQRPGMRSDRNLRATPVRLLGRNRLRTGLWAQQSVRHRHHVHQQTLRTQ